MLCGQPAGGWVGGGCRRGSGCNCFCWRRLEVVRPPPSRPALPFVPGVCTRGARVDHLIGEWDQKVIAKLEALRARLAALRQPSADGGGDGTGGAKAIAKQGGGKATAAEQEEALEAEIEALEEKVGLGKLQRLCSTPGCNKWAQHESPGVASGCSVNRRVQQDGAARIAGCWRCARPRLA